MSLHTDRGENTDSEVLSNATAEHCCAMGTGDSTSSWLSGSGNNNNNSLLTTQICKEQTASGDEIVSKWNCQSCEASASATSSDTVSAAVNILAIDERFSEIADSVEDKGGGQSEQTNGARAVSPTVDEGAVAVSVKNYACYVPGAVSLTPPEKSHSNGTSINNSTENLSCSSDNFYGHDDIILLDDVDVDVEEVSLNSDDCVYAYRGDGADFNIGLIHVDRAEGSAAAVDDETDFLEMDFEPDPLSEVECGSAEAPLVHHHLSDYIMQCNISNHVSGRHSANIGVRENLPERLLSSPIDDLPPPKALQAQSLLSKNLARISLHLDQIKGVESNECDGSERLLREERHALLSNCSMIPNSTLAQSLPNTLNSSLFGNDMDKAQEADKKASPSKITGAKPKRFSTSSSSSSKHSTKSRQSIVSTSLLPAFASGSTSFDERSVSCTEFRSVAPDVSLNGVFSEAVSTVPNDYYNWCDENCLDCLEKEFITSTVGQSPGIDCQRCRKHSSTISLHSHVKDYNGSRKQPTSFFGGETLFESTLNYMSFQRKDGFLPKTMRIKPTDGFNLKIGAHKKESGNQRTLCDNFSGQKLLKDFTLTESEIVTISTVNLTEASLVQALEKLNVSYSAELIEAHFNYTTQLPFFKKVGGCFKNLRQFILYQSKKYCNYMKIKRLIELATRHNVRVKYKQVSRDAMSDVVMVPVDVDDILQQWSVNQDLNVLKKLDKRFQDANVLGKVANIIRLSKQNELSRQSLPDFISIPQYYPSGHLTLTKTC